MFNVTISSFSELDWISQLPRDTFNIMKYTLDPELPKSEYNIPSTKGFEATVFLKSIIDNYESLTDNNIFIHGCEFSDYHDGSIVDLIQNNVYTSTGYTNINNKYLKSVYNRHFEYFITEFYNKTLLKYIGSHVPFENWHNNAKGYSQFVVSKEKILSKPKQLYIDLYEWIQNSDYGERISEPDIEAKFLEWSWNIIFDKPLLYQEKYCEFVSIRGLAGSCDVKPNRDILSDQPNFELSDYGNINDYDTVFVPTLDLNRFLDEVFYVVNKKIILVTGCCVKSVPVEICKIQNIDRCKLLNSPNLIHWYTQNCDKPSKKVSHVPLGIDYHTLNRGDHKWGVQQSPLQQENELKSLISTETKSFNLYSNFHFVKDRYNDRNACISFLKSNPDMENITVFEKTYTSRTHAWEEQAKAAFCLSPLGMGLDCHRTWEALLLKCVPITRKSTLCGMLDLFGVVQVSEWNELTKDLISERYLDTSNEDVRDKLTLNYWTQQINMKKNQL